MSLPNLFCLHALYNNGVVKNKVEVTPLKKEQIFLQILFYARKNQLPVEYTQTKRIILKSFCSIILAIARLRCKRFCWARRISMRGWCKSLVSWYFKTLFRALRSRRSSFILLWCHLTLKFLQILKTTTIQQAIFWWLLEEYWCKWV